jgi:hypothetical protein
VIADKQCCERNSDCYALGASDVRLLKVASSEPDQHQVPGRATANERPSKRDKPTGEPVFGAEQTARSSTLWEASDQRRAPTPILKRHSYGWRFVRLAASFGGLSPSSLCRSRSLPASLPKAVPHQTSTCHRGTFPVVSELPIKRLTRATRVWGRASSPQSKEIIVRQSDCDQAVRGEGSHRKGHSQRKAEAAPGRLRQSNGVDGRLPRIKRHSHSLVGSRV